MDSETIEISGGLAGDLKEAALQRGVTLRELVIHILLQFVEDSTDSDDEDEEPDDESEDQDEVDEEE